MSKILEEEKQKIWIFTFLTWKPPKVLLPQRNVAYSLKDPVGDLQALTMPSQKQDPLNVPTNPVLSYWFCAI